LECIQSPALALIHVKVRHSVVTPGVKVGGLWYTTFYHRLFENLQRVPTQALFVHPPASTGTVILAPRRRRTTVMIFVELEEG
jgi:hypothetical protein